MKRLIIAVFLLCFLFLISCQQKNDGVQMRNKQNYIDTVKERIKAYAPVKVEVDTTFLTKNEKILLVKLSEAGKIADEIFWQQSAHDARQVRDSLAKLTGGDNDLLKEYVRINYGPYDVIYGNERFMPGEPKTRPLGGGFYPIDMTKEEFEKAITDNPSIKTQFEDLYTVIVRENGKLKALPYSKYYPEIEALASKLEEAANFADDKALKDYLISRAKALRTNDYYESDMKWMDVKSSNIDVVIGPIETYQDQLFGYKAAFEAVVMVKDWKATKQFEMFKKHIPYFEKNLPEDPKFIRSKINFESQLNLVNVAYYGGDCQKGTKTIAASLPNDPRVREAKGGKNSMYLNMMRAKFEKNLVPIANIILNEELLPYIDEDAFITFTTLHEVSHTLGRGYVYGNDKLEVRTALKERYSAIEECKADILSMYNHLHLLNLKEFDANMIRKAQATYLAGLFRSIRFGSESAHAKANLIQFNYLREKGAIILESNGKYKIDESKFWEAVKGLANLILTTEATGDYAKAGEILSKYAVITPEINNAISKLQSVPRDIDSSYLY
jgi:hypothetical protein